MPKNATRVLHRVFPILCEISQEVHKLKKYRASTSPLEPLVWYPPVLEPLVFSASHSRFFVVINAVPREHRRQRVLRTTSPPPYNKSTTETRNGLHSSCSPVRRRWRAVQVRKPATRALLIPAAGGMGKK